MARGQLRVVVDALEGFVDQVIRALVLDLVANLRRAPSEGGTPVDTGWARANWVPQIGSAFQGTAGTREAAEAGSIDQATAAAGLTNIATKYKVKSGQAHVTNNVPYIVDLNDGSSRQAPSGFVQQAIIKSITVDLPLKVPR